jgi:hypothetical protein
MTKAFALRALLFVVLCALAAMTSGLLVPMHVSM